MVARPLSQYLARAQLRGILKMTRMSDDEFESIGDDGILSKGFTAIYVEAKRARAAELRYKEALEKVRNVHVYPEDAHKNVYDIVNEALADDTGVL